MTKCHKLVKERHKNVNIGDKESEASVKNDKNANLSDKNSPTSLKRCKIVRLSEKYHKVV